MSATPEQILLKYWKYDKFRPGQIEIIQSILNQHDVLALLPTGGGKSICFQVPALILGGLTLVVSPLIALMKDQVDGLKDKGISAIYIHSGQTWSEIKLIMENALKGHYQLLYVSPERLTSKNFEGYLENLPIKLLVVDEAHCVSMWGKDFRPSFLKISQVRKFIPKVPICAFTASAPQWIQDDVVQGLSLRNVQIHQGSFDRNNLVFYAIETENKSGVLLNSLQKSQGCSIVFSNTRREVQEIARFLVKNNISAHFYHGGLDSVTRSKRQQEWIQNKVRVMVCTNAFGMGVDKPDVRYVYHMMPSATPEDYYQEAGRAGRDGKLSYCVMLHQHQDWSQLFKHVENQHPSEQACNRAYHAIMNAVGIAPGYGYQVSYPVDFQKIADNYKIPMFELYYAAKAIESMGQWQLSEGVKTPSRVKFIYDFQSVYDFKLRYPVYEPIIDVLLRSFGGIFDSHAIVYEVQLAKRVRATETQIIQWLTQLHKSKMIEYLPRTEDPLVTLLEDRSMYPSFKMSVIQELKARRMSAVQKMETYSTLKECRSVFWIEHFTKIQNEPCGQCDNCKKLKLKPSVLSIQNQIFQLLATEISLDDFSLNVPHQFKEDYFAVLNELIDRKKVGKTENNLLFLSA
jgi:ATP-dependent DNA helicase RecQ